VNNDDVELVAGQTSGSVTGENVRPTYLFDWKQASWVNALPGGTGVRYQIYDGSGILLPDSVIPGNSSGSQTSPIDLSRVSTTTYPALALHANLSTNDASTTPSILSWQITYDYGPEPLPNIGYTMHGAKTIGTNSGSPVYKYNVTSTTGATGSVTLPAIEWDTYTTTLTGSTYDISSSCTPQPITLAPNSSVTNDLYLVAHTANSLLVDVRDANGVVIPNATVILSRSGFTSTIAANYCGQSFFSGVSAGTKASGNAYTVNVSASGYTSYSNTKVDVSGTSRLSVVLSP
jgi:hypothetical protein